MKSALLRIGFVSALALAACTPEPELPLPDVASLPHDYHGTCSCVVGGECVMLEELPGEWEIRNLSCRWTRRNRVAECRFNQRFVRWYFDDDDSIRREPGQWSERTIRARRLDRGDWCRL